MAKKNLVLFSCLGLLLLALAALVFLQLSARQRFATRGQTIEAPPPVADTVYSPLCVNTALEQFDAAQLDGALTLAEEGRFTWVRQRFPWSEIEPEPGRFEWARWDAIVSGAVEHGLQLLPVLTSPPAWAGMPPDPEAFAHFAAALANHYSAQLVYYQIWHNPNLGDSWGGQADPLVYAEILAHVAPAIREADPGARIVLGGLAPNTEAGPANYNEPRFLELLSAAGASPYYDVVAVNPLGFDSGPEDRTVDLARLNFSRVILVREAMEDLEEDDKAVWATLIGWNSLPATWDSPASIWGHVDESTQAEYTIAALDRAESEWPWMGVLCVNNLQPRPADPSRAVLDAEEHWGFSMVGPAGELRPLYTALQAWASRPQVARVGVYPASSPLITYTGGWRLGPLGADIPLNASAAAGNARATLNFEGTGVRLRVRRGAYLAFLFATVDGKPAPELPRDETGRAYVVLYDPLAKVATVTLARQLPYGVHTVELVAERGWYQWALVSWEVAHEQSNPPLLALFWLAAVALAAGAAFLASRVEWRALLRWLKAGYARLGAPGQLLLATVLSAIFGFAAWMVWAQGAFRRLGDGVGVGAVLLALGGFYFAPWTVVLLLSGGLLAALVLLQPGLGLALTIAAAPFYLHPVSLFGRSFALSELLLLPTLVGCVVRIVNAQRNAGRGAASLWRHTFAPVGALLLVGVLATFAAEYRHEALRELRLVLLEPALFYVALRLTPLEPGERRRILDFWLASAALIAVIGLVQYFVLGNVITAEGGVRRLRSIYGSPNNVGLYLGRVWPLLLVELSQGLQARRKQGLRCEQGLQGKPCKPLRFWISGVALAGVGLALLLSFSRGAILLGIPAGLFTLGMLAGGRWRKATLVGLAIFALLLIPLFTTPRFAALLNPSSGTAFLRVALWRSAWAMFRDHPWLGVGPDNFLYAYRTRYILPTAWEEFNLSHPHNWILDFATRLGVLGLGVFLWLQTHFWQRVLRLARQPGSARPLLWGLAASMAVMLAHGLVDASFFYVDLAYVFFLTLAAVEWLGENHTSDFLDSP